MLDERPVRELPRDAIHARPRTSWWCGWSRSAGDAVRPRSWGCWRRRRSRCSPLGGFAVAKGWFGLGDLLAPRTTDRSAPVLVEKLRNLSEFHGASGTFATTVDLEHTIGVIPRFVAGDRAVYSGVGTVDATRRPARPGDTGDQECGRSARGAAAARAARRGRASTRAKSHVMNRDRGFLDRIGGVFVDSPTSDRALEQASRRRIAAAAATGELRHTRRGEHRPDDRAAGARHRRRAGRGAVRQPADADRPRPAAATVAYGPGHG